MSTKPVDESAPGRPPAKAEHGYRSEVSWSGGQGRQEDRSNPGGSRQDMGQGSPGRRNT